MSRTSATFGTLVLGAQSAKLYGWPDRDSSGKLYREQEAQPKPNSFHET